MKVIFKQGDIVKLSQSCLDNLSKELFFPQNLFEIKSINYNEAIVFLESISQSISIEDILPVTIDGKEDRDIYYDPIVAAGLYQKMVLFLQFPETLLNTIWILLKIL